MGDNDSAFVAWLQIFRQNSSLLTSKAPEYGRGALMLHLHRISVSKVQREIHFGMKDLWRK